MFSVIWRDWLNSEFLYVWFCFLIQKCKRKDNGAKFGHKLYSALSSPWSFYSTNSSVQELYVAYELCPSFPISNFATEISPFLGFSCERNQNAKSHLDLSYLIRENLSVDFRFPLDFSSCFIGGVTSIHWTRVWDFYFIFHWTDFLVLVIKMTPTIWSYLGWFVIVLLNKKLFYWTNLKSSFQLPKIVIIKINRMWTFLMQFSVSIKYIIEAHWSLLIEKLAK